MKKPICLLPLLLLLLLPLLAACGSDDILAPSGFRLASNPEIVQYRLFVPNSWIIDRQDGMTAAHCSEYDLSNVSVTVHELNSQQMAEADPITAYFAHYRADFESTVGPMELLTDGVDLSFGDGERGAEGTKYYPAKKYEFRKTFSGADYQVMQIFCRKDTRMVLFTYTASVDHYQDNLPTIEDMLNNFYFEK